MHEKNSIIQFTDKYTKSGNIGDLLVQNFFKTISKISPYDVANVLEVGCGAGYSMQHLCKFFGPSVVYSACDIDPELVTLTKQKNPAVECMTASIYELPYPDHSFDIVVCLEVLEHLEYPDKALAELARVSKKYIVASTPHEPLWRVLNMVRGKYWSDLGNTPGHINHWSSKGLRKLIEKYFDIIEIRNPIPWTIIYGKTKNSR